MSEIIKFKTSLMEGVFVEVPENAYDFSYDGYRHHVSATVTGEYGQSSDYDWFSQEIKGNYEILCQTSSITESEAAQVVFNAGIGSTSLELFWSWIKWYNLNLEKNYLILKSK